MSGRIDDIMKPKQLPKVPSKTTDPDNYATKSKMKRSVLDEKLSNGQPDVDMDSFEDDSCAVIVAVRLRPFARREIEHPQNERIVMMDGCETSVRNSNNANPEHRFQYDYCFDSFDRINSSYSSQQRVYEQLAHPLLHRAIQGYNTCLFAYGQTGSGKSYCIMGHGDDDGIIPRFARDLFLQADELKANSKDVTDVTVETSFFEIYNEKIHDLLAMSKGESQSKQNLKVREHPDYGPYVEGLSNYPVYSYEDISSLLTIGNRQRATASTGMNDKSSRSHSVFTITLTQTKTMKFEDEQHSHSVVSRINLVDLAGSERQSSAQTSGVRLKEGASINRSLLSLGKVIWVLAESTSQTKKRKLFVPYRDSVLTYLLKQSLGGNARTAMIATISPSSLNLEETLSTLRYAQKARSIINSARVNEDPKARLIRELREEIERLKTGQNGVVGESDASALHEILALRRALKDREADLEEKQRDWQAQLKLAEKAMHEKLASFEQSQKMDRSVDNKLPHLVNLNEDPQLSEILLYRLQEGPTKVGRQGAPGKLTCDIQLAGALVADFHCTFHNERGQVTITPIDSDAPTFLNGNQITSAQRLHHGDRVVIGGDHYFRFSHPSSVDPSKRNSTSKQRDFIFAKTEIEQVQNERLQKERAKIEEEMKREMEEQLREQDNLHKEKLQQQRDEYESKIQNLQTDMLKVRNARPLNSPIPDTPELTSSNKLISNLMAEKERLQKWTPKRRLFTTKPDDSVPKSNASVPAERGKADLYKVTLLIREANKLSQHMKMPSVFDQEEVDNVIVVKVTDNDLSQFTYLTVDKFEERLADMREAFSAEDSPDESMALFCNPNDVWRSNNDKNTANETRLEEILNNENQTSSIEQVVRSTEVPNGRRRVKNNRLNRRQSISSCSILAICKDFASFSLQKHRGSMQARTVFDQILRQCELVKKSVANLLNTLSSVTKGELSLEEFDADELTGASCFQLASSSEVLLAQTQLCSSMCEELEGHIADTSHRMVELSQKISRQIVQLMQALASGVERSVHDCASSLMSATLELCKSCGMMSLITDTNVSLYAEHFVQLSPEVQSMCARGGLEQCIHTSLEKLSLTQNASTIFNKGPAKSHASDAIFDSVGKVLAYLSAFIHDYNQTVTKALDEHIDEGADYGGKYERCSTAVVNLNSIADHLNALTKPMFTQGKEYDRAIMLKGADSIKRCCRKLASDYQLNTTPLETAVRHLFTVTEAEGKVRVKVKTHHHDSSRAKRLLPQIGTPEKTRRLLPTTPTSNNNNSSYKHSSTNSADSHSKNNADSQSSPVLPPRSVSKLAAMFNQNGDS